MKTRPSAINVALWPARALFICWQGPEEGRLALFTEVSSPARRRKMVSGTGAGLVAPLDGMSNGRLRPTEISVPDAYPRTSITRCVPEGIWGSFAAWLAKDAR